jgi:hypothetical protein
VNRAPGARKLATLPDFWPKIDALCYGQADDAEARCAPLRGNSRTFG